MRLSDYGMSRERGFLSPHEIDEVFLPTRFDAVIDTASG
jgi:indoleamine 2,3-dioxygenase